MKATTHKPVPELHMSAKEFDRIMGEALGGYPETAPKPKRIAKPKKKAPRK